MECKIRMTENKECVYIGAYDENGNKLNLLVDIVDGKIVVRHISEIYNYG